MFVGDVYHLGGIDEAELNAAAGSAGQGHWSFFPHGPGGHGGSGNLVEAYNDGMSDEATNPGNDLLVGDVFSPAGSGERLNALAGVGGRNGGNGGNFNQVRAFKDVLIGDSGNDLLVGDVYDIGADDDVVFNVYAGAGGDGAAGGAGGDNNTVEAFADTLNGGVGGDLMIGDVFQVSAPIQEIAFVLLAGAPGLDGAPGGVGNRITAFCDSLAGGVGDDFLIGDARRASGVEDIDLTFSGGAGNTIVAFQDNLDGGVGDDQLIGDFYGDVATDPVLLNFAGGFSGRAGLFADTLSGGVGADRLVGGLGADRMSGGVGADTFVYQAATSSTWSAPCRPGRRPWT